MSDRGHSAGWCVHYRPPDENTKTCEAGVEYEKLRGVPFHARPCYLDVKGCSKPGAVHCEHLRIPTAEEIATRDAFNRASIARLGVVLEAIMPWRQAHKRENHVDVIECPCCGGKLHLSIAYRGHVHGKCETEGCVEWIE